MASTPENPPAFALQERVQTAANGDQWLSPKQEGMSLRDWFAGQALTSLFSFYVLVEPARWAADAYAIADAMLAQREKGQ